MKRYLILQKDMALNNNHILKDCESYKSAMIERSKLSKDGLKGLQIYVHNSMLNRIESQMLKISNPSHYG